jgi:hypothetical protein
MSVTNVSNNGSKDMDKKLWLNGLVAGATLLVALPASALVLNSENNVTIYDKNGSENLGIGGEDNEVEPGMVRSQNWDLEGVFFDGNALTLVGGYDFLNGYGGFDSGDLFLSTKNGEPTFGDIHRNENNESNAETTNTYGYDYVLKWLDPTGDSSTPSKFAVYELNNESSLQQAWYQQNEGSSPWRANTDNLDAVAEGSISFYSLENGDYFLSNQATGFESYYNGKTGSRYAMSFDLTDIYNQLETDGTFYSHFTMGCGNDNLMGTWTATVPEPATFVLFGVGIAGLWFSRRRQASSDLTA